MFAKHWQSLAQDHFAMSRQPAPSKMNLRTKLSAAGTDAADEHIGFAAIFAPRQVNQDENVCGDKGLPAESRATPSMY